MSDKPKAGLVTAVVIAPLVVLCCAGPPLIGPAVVAITAWIGGIGPVAMVLAGILSALLVGSFLRWRKHGFAATGFIQKGKK